MKKTLVIGASTNPKRYSYLAIEKLRQYGHEVFALGRDKGAVAGVVIDNEQKNYAEIDTITLYVNPMHQKPMYSFILSLKPQRIIFNPGTENPELEVQAKAQGIQCLRACTLVMLSIGNY